MLEDRFLRHAVPAQSSGTLTDGGVWLLNTWSGDPERQPGLVAHIAALDASTRPYDERLNASFWAALATHPGLAGYAAARRLMTATSEAVLSPKIAFLRTADEHGTTNTGLARACYAARCAGLSVEGVIRALAGVDAHRIQPRLLDGVLREFQGLLYHGASSASGHAQEADAKRASEDDLFECYRLIARGALGSLFGEEFTRYLRDRLEDEIWIRQQLLQKITPSGRRLTRAVSPAGGQDAARAGARDTPTVPTHPDACADPARARHWLRRLWRRATPAPSGGGGDDVHRT